ncbi:MAG: hypothetical protein NWQ24_04020 [Haliea sp.]|nr:hypothetical protein [Haliea sp.]
MTQQADLVIHNEQVIGGSGQPAFQADIATRIPHAALRVFAISERALKRETANAEDRAGMSADASGHPAKEA